MRRLQIAVCLVVLAGTPSAAEDVIDARPLNGLRADAVALILNGRDGGAFPAALLVTPRGACGQEENNCRVDLWIGVGGSALLGTAGEDDDKLKLEIYVYAINPNGGVGAHLGQTVRVDLEEHGETLAAGGLRFAGHLDLAPGPYQLRALVRESRSQRFTLRHVALEVPAAGAPDASEAPDAPYLLPPFFADPGSWVTVREAPRDGDIHRPVLESPLPVAGEDVAWTGIPKGFEAPPPAVAERRIAEGLAARKRDKRRQTVTDAYRRVLLELTAGDVDAAVEALVTMETAVFEARRINEARQLVDEGEQAVIQALAAEDAEAVLPLAVLHLRAHQRYRDGSKTVLASHHNRRVAALGRLYKDLPQDRNGDGTVYESSAALVAQTLVDLGRSLRRQSSLAEARGLFEDALRLDGGNGAALLELALVEEYLGDYEGASATLQRLLKHLPGHTEARLRLGVNLKRQGREQEATAALQEVIDRGATDGPDSWPTAVAYQELSRIHLDLDRLGEAARLLEAGLARLPDEEHLYLALAFVLDRRGDRRGAGEVLERGLRRGFQKDGSAASPRHLYGRKSRQGWDRSEADRELLRGAQSRLPILARALAATEEEK